MAYVAYMATLKLVGNMIWGDTTKSYLASWIPESVASYEGCCYSYKTIDVNIIRIVAYRNENLP